MMDESRITRICVQKKNPQRVNVYIDGEFSFGLYLETAAWLEVGQYLSEDKIKELLEKDTIADAYTKALDYISYKPRTAQETRRKLQTVGFSESVIMDTIRRLKENGILNDWYYAQQWVEERQRLKPRSSYMLQRELRLKGIPERLIQSALEGIDDFHTACEAARSHLARYEDLPKPEFRKKLGNFLAGKGYSYDVITEVTRTLWNEIKPSNNELL